MGETQRRRGEGHSAYVARDRRASKAATVTHSQKAEAAEAASKAAFEKATGKKYGIGTHGAYMKWKKSRKPAVTARDAGDALAGSE